MLSQRLQQKLQQKLSPQQILLMKLLQVPTVALDQRIKQELEENPVLEDLSDSRETESDTNDEYENEYSDDNSRDTTDFDFNDYIDEDDVDSYKLKANNKSADEERKEIPYASEASFQETLTDQLIMLGLDEKQYLIGTTLIGNLDDSGYLMREVKAMVDDFAFSQNMVVKANEILDVLAIIQELDPPGVGARSLQECLLLQLQRNEEQTPAVQLAYRILNTQFERFYKKHYDKIIEKLSISEEELKAAIDEVLKLNPKPGNSVGGSSKLNQYVIPDFIINNNNGVLELSLNNRDTPELRVNQTYAEMLQGYAVSKQKTEQQKDAVMFIKQKIDSARWFIEAIKQRQNTLYVTMNAIMNYQHDYFLDGDVSKLRPMKLKDVSDVVGLDISTISRVANSKYAETHFGTFLLRDFFSKSMINDAGEGISTTEIKSILKECIENEDKTSPLNDDELTDILNKKGFGIARRTVAKYREGLDIRVARLRKEIS